MEYKTLSEHITEVETLLSQVAGVSVQTYAEARIAKFILEAFDIVFKKAWWAQFRHFQSVALTGTDGFPVSDLDFWEFGDIAAIYPSDRQIRLTKLPFPMNPFLLTGTQAQYIDPQPGKKLFRVWPLASVGTLIIQGRKKPDTYPFGPDDEVPFDDLVIQNIAAWRYCMSDGNNPLEAEGFQAVFDQRLTNLLGEEVGNVPMDHDPRFVDIPNQWYEVP
jgi:hypothetical protein